MSLLGTLGHIAGGVIGFATGGVPGAIAGAGLGPKPPSSLPSSVPGFGGFQMPFPVMARAVSLSLATTQVGATPL